MILIFKKILCMFEYLCMFMWYVEILILFGLLWRMLLRFWVISLVVWSRIFC